LTAYALERLRPIAGLTTFGPPEASERGGAVSFVIEGIHPHDIAEICNREAVCIRAGHHCAQPLARRLGVAWVAFLAIGGAGLALREAAPETPVEAAIEQWERANASRLVRARSALQEVGKAGQLDLATLSVISRQLRGLAR
jgi:selenocysteine lyase/cysteine desulfurase